MSVIAAVLLVPTEGDPHKLLGDPESTNWKCGARLPIAGRNASGWLLPMSQFSPHGDYVGVTSKALILAWDSEPLVEGLDRLLRVPIGISIAGRLGFPRGTYHLQDAIRLAGKAQEADRGIAVYLDSLHRVVEGP